MRKRVGVLLAMIGVLGMVVLALLAIALVKWLTHGGWALT